MGEKEETFPATKRYVADEKTRKEAELLQVIHSIQNQIHSIQEHLTKTDEMIKKRDEIIKKLDDRIENLELEIDQLKNYLDRNESRNVKSSGPPETSV
ncbi:unnamed protein product [Didymodactylos carnosus]|uniref:Uncharacterized protein n=1 Tax=Didymodactylos carnosus TaxID=1234261 RepID=A0A814XCW6_9BILA|nr:unnamed protein product [Didymodactylos carnosus]CAF1214636.1 unnamed protein product [Didymodactylos carnosus]CAF3794852.1 unnamed protein product [Didymodactylos carnosus]CAF3978491.1 unnamed protein product [Didymodactylos carnosus]